MQRVTRSTAVASLPATPGSEGTPGYFTGGNPLTATPATVPGYEWFNRVQEELVALVLRAGLTLDGADNAQIRKALDRLFGGGLRTVSATATLTGDDAGLVLVSAAGGNVALTLPAASANNGRPIPFLIVRTDTSGNTVTLQRAGSNTLEGATTLAVGVGARLPLLSDGVSAWYAETDGAAPSAVVMFTSGGTFTAVRSGWHLFEVWGGGGGGSGGVGGSGGYSMKLVWLNRGDTVTITIGAAGTFGTNGGAAGNGGTSSAGALCSATGGVGAATGPSSGGGASGGDVNAAGQVGIDLDGSASVVRGGLPPAWIGYGQGGDAGSGSTAGNPGTAGAVRVRY